MEDKYPRKKMKPRLQNESACGFSNRAAGVAVPRWGVTVCPTPSPRMAETAARCAAASVPVTPLPQPQIRAIPHSAKGVQVMTQENQMTHSRPQAPSARISVIIPHLNLTVKASSPKGQIRVDACRAVVRSK